MRGDWFEEHQELLSAFLEPRDDDAVVIAALRWSAHWIVGRYLGILTTVGLTCLSAAFFMDGLPFGSRLSLVLLAAPLLFLRGATREWFRETLDVFIPSRA